MTEQCPPHNAPSKTTPKLAHPAITNHDLLELEQAIQRGIASRSFEGLKVLGFGEIGVAIGWPKDHPQLVVKRAAASSSRAEVDAWFDRIRRYEAGLRPHLAVAETDQRVVADGPEWFVPYMVQRRFDRATLCEQILADTEPTKDHPMVIAIRDAVLSVSEGRRWAIDSQFSNFAWVANPAGAHTLTLFDTGSPFIFDAEGNPDVDLGTYARAMPAILTPVTKKLVDSVSRDFLTPHGNLAHAALSAVRIGQERWLDAILATFNTALGADDQVSRSDVEKQMAGIHTQMKAIKWLARGQRAWTTKVRRRPYDFFITDSFTGELL